jgi:probable F420-dependent oxidoreductase
MVRFQAMTAQRWGVTVPLLGISLADHERVYREAEDLGYTDFWGAESDVDGVVPIALAAAWTKQATLGTAILGVFNRGPALLAMTAAALGEAAPGRFCLGVGSGSNVNVERWNGMRFARPLRRVADVVRAVRMALDGEQMNYDGETLKVAGYRVGRPAPLRIPIFIAALQEKMLRQAVRLADGVCLTWVSADDVTKVMAVVQDEATKAGKDPKAFQVMCRINICPTTDPRAREAYKRAITAYLNVPVYRKYHAWLGRGDELRPMQERWDAGDRRGALAVVPERAIDELGVFGTPDECRAHVARFVANGVTIPVMNFMNIEEPSKRGHESWQMLRAMAPIAPRRR